MPNNIMFSNKEALRKAVERVEWKIQMSYGFLANDPVFKKYVGGQYGFDIRDVDNFFVFFVNIKDYEDKTEEERIKLFNSEASKIAHAFYETHGETEGMPDYKSVEPYIRRMYDEVDADYNIDWDDVDAIEHYLSSLHIQQTLGMMAEKFAVEFAKNFTLEEKQSIDSKMQSTFANQRIFQSKLVQENSNYSMRLGKGSMDQGTCQYFIEAGISIATAKATKNGYDPIVLDPEYSEVFKNFFVNDEFEVDQTGEVDSATVFNQDDAADAFVEFLPKISAKDAFEHVAVQSTTNDYIYPDEEFVLVDGKSVNDYIKEQMTQGMTEAKAKIEAGKWLRRAMLDGNSVVTLMRPIINGDGSVVFQHQQIKTDLDKVNAIDRAENYSWFRRALDALRIYRIPKKCVSNKARDAVQAQKLAGAELQNALKAVEDKFIERYNLRASQEIPYKIQQAFPKISRIENVMENQLSSDAPVNSVETEPMRMSLNLSSHDLEKPVSNVPEEPKEINAEEVKIEENTIEEPQVQIQNETVSEESVQENNVEENKVEEPDEISYKEKHDKASIDKNLEKDIKSQIVDIMKINADVGEHRLPEKADSIFENTLRNAHDHCQAMDNEYGDAARDDLMRDFAKNLFENTYMHVRDAHVYYDDNIAHRVIAAQKITNLILSTYTPVGFDAEKYVKYADDYALNNKEMLREALANLYEDCAETDEAFDSFMEELNAARLESSPAMDEEEVEQTEEEIEKENEEITASEDVDNDNELEEQKRIEEENARKAEEARRKAEEESARVTPVVPQPAPQPSPLRFGCEERAHDAMQNSRVISSIESTIREALDGKANRSMINGNMINNLIGSMFAVADQFNINHDALGAAKASARKVEGHIVDGIQTIFQSAYVGLRPFGMQKKDQIIAAQKISDAILNSVTPVAFNDDLLEKYTKNYAINDPTMVADVLQYAEGFSKSICNELVEEARAALQPVVAEPVAAEVEETKIEGTKIEEPVVEETKIEEPVVEGTKIEEPVVEETKIEEPVVEEPVAKETVVEEPVVEKTEPVTQPEETEPVTQPEETMTEPQVQSEEEAAKKQAEAEEAQKKLEEIKNNVQQITVTQDNFNELFEVAKNDTALEARVRVELEAILNEVYTGAYVNDNATSILYNASTIPNLFPDGQFTTEDSNIGGMVFEIFDDAYNKLDSAKVDIDQKIIYAQKITDIIIRNYPPVCHDIDGFRKFADNYIINGTTLYSQDKLRAFLAEKEIPAEEIEAHVSRINGAVAKPDDVKEERYELEEQVNPFEHSPNYIHQNKAEAPKINRFKPRRLFGQGEGELYSAGRHQARKDELERLRAYDQEAMAKTEAIAEDDLEYLEDIEDENVLEETAIETNENEIVAENPVEEVTESIDDIANNLVANALSNAMSELEEEPNAEEVTESIDDIANNLVANALSNAMSELEEEEAQRKAEEEEARRRAEEEAKEEAARRKAESDAKKTNIVLRDMCVRRIRDTKIAVETRERLFEIFHNPSYEDKHLRTCINMANEIPQHMADQFEKSRYDMLTPQGVERMTKSVFSEAFSCTEESGADLVTRIGMAQRITDLMMKDYSVVAFVPTEFGTYADNYIVLNKGILKEMIKDQTSALSENEFSDLMKRVDREMARELSGWNARDMDRKYNQSLGLRYEEIYEKIMGEKAPELKEVSEEEFRSFKAQYEENLKNDKLTENVKAQISEIYSEAGLKDSKLEAATNAAFDDFVDVMTQTYNDLQKVTDYLKTAKDMMTYTAEVALQYVFASAYNYVSDRSERLLITQRVTDVLLNNYSPVAFVNGDLDKFADNYIISSNDRLDVWMEKFAESDSKKREIFLNDVEKLMNRAKDGFVEEEINNEPEEIDEDDIDDIEDEIEAEEKPKEIERESIPGLKDDVEGKVSTDKSARVNDENSKKAPSLNND